MSDYIIKIDVDKLKPHPINKSIYDYDEPQQNELIHSIELNGLLEPITIDNQNYVYSGHRRLQAVKHLGWSDVDCRLTHIVNPILAIIESNRQRKKTASELLRESELLKEAYKNHRGQRNDLNGVGRNWSIVNVSNQLGVSTTKLKKLKSIQHYQPELLNDIDLGLISIGKAYEIVRKNYILNNSSETKIEDFESELFKLLMKYRPLNGELMETIEKYMSTLGSNEPKVGS